MKQYFWADKHNCQASTLYIPVKTCQILQGVRSEESYLCKCKQCFFFYKTCKMSNRY